MAGRARRQLCSIRDQRQEERKTLDEPNFHDNDVPGMRAGDCFISARFRANLPASLLLGLCLVFAACDRMVTPRSTQLMKDADARAAEGDYQRAINLYESALDGTPKSADIHYRLALLYDDKLNDQLHALHHFKRYLALAPAGPHASEAKEFMKRDELALVTELSGDAVVPRAEAARLRNENLTLRKELDESRARAVAPADAKTKKATKARPHPSPARRSTHSHSQ